jgi:hypothetical protein
MQAWISNFISICMPYKPTRHLEALYILETSLTL